jgi:ribonuclease HII
MKFAERWIIGIDEVGRGPLAGPVSVGIFGAKEKMGKWILKNIFENKLRDSKKLNSKKREEIYKKFYVLKKEGETLRRGSGQVFFSVSHVSNKIIDKKGIGYAINLAIKNLLSAHLSRRSFSEGGASNIDLKNCTVRLDGLLKAPKEFKNQKTIIKGDEKNVFIACASIVAKVSRDRLMCRLSLKYPVYKLQIHKGYATSLHRSLIKKYGLSALHRKSFCQNLTISSK